MASYRVKLLERREIAADTMAFFFEKPADYHYLAGQYFVITLIDPPETDTEGNSRSLTIASAPHEAHLMIAIRMRNAAFKRVLKTMPLGVEVRISRALGNIVLHDDAKRPAAFLAGGIGITPFRSIIVDVTARKLPHHLYLVYANPRPEDTAFLDELTELAHKNKRFTFVPTMTRVEASSPSWNGERGYITPEMLWKYIPDVAASMYSIAGPPKMVTAMLALLDDMGINLASIHAEEFTGY
ncbi:MAG: FAD-dependent oxidoreductase [Deltaproteobacteria bacterium]|nr:FAD-dependent oxidoreductase [Deltaproteobacteria bacterium]